ncbi:MAG: diguanylate cyclase [Spirochaetes bacterium]|nr:diguanylate cyclase [Spirochaetota bacterium]
MKNIKTIETFKEKIISLLTEDDLNKEYLVSQINELSKSPHRKYFYSKLLELFVHLSFNEEEAKKHWESIFKNYQYFKNVLDRNIGLRVAMFDYFINLNAMLSNPILVEIRLFRETEKLAMIDSLTGLFNRRYFDIAIKKELKRATRFDKDVSILILDIDNFKLINDTRGHLFGDNVLNKLAGFLKKYSREEDVICRYGGEEFIIILPETIGDEALKYAERIRKGLKELELFKNSKITFSGGIATFPYDGKSLVQLLKNADKSLYMAKYSGKDCIIKSRTDNRRYKRYNNSWKFLYQPLEKTFKHTGIKEIYTQDVSLGGVRFVTGDEFSLDTKLLLNIKLPDDEELVIVAKVIWLKKVNDVSYAYGVKFYDINSEQLKKMKNVLTNNRNLPEE